MNGVSLKIFLQIIYIHEYDFPFTFHAPVRLLYYKSRDLSHDIPLFLFNLKTGLIFLTCSISNRKILKAPSAATIAQLMFLREEENWRTRRETLEARERHKFQIVWKSTEGYSQVVTHPAIIFPTWLNLAFSGENKGHYFFFMFVFHAK